MKQLKYAAVVLLCLPVAYELFGMCVNHISTDRQTKRMKANLTKTVSDAVIFSEHSETGNSSGTGNHVDCVSVVNFSSSKSLEELTACLTPYYTFDDWNCRLDKTDAGYVFYLNTRAPFADNIEGH